MDVLKMFVAVLIFVFEALLFPVLQSEVDNYTGTGGASSFIRVFPYIFLVLGLIPALYLIHKGAS